MTRTELTTSAGSKGRRARDQEVLLTPTASFQDRGRPLREKHDLLASVNGVITLSQDARVPAADDGLLRGDGAFEVVRCYLGHPFKWRRHLARLDHSCRALRLPYSRRSLERECRRLLETDAGASRDLRIVLTRGGTRLLLLERVRPLRPIRLGLVHDEPRLILDGVKSLSYAGNMLAMRLAAERGFDEALIVSSLNHVIEAQTAAFFWVTPEGTLCTPPLVEGILNSISRRIVLDRVPTVEQVCRLNDAMAATEAFLAGSGREVQPVAAIEERRFGGVPGPVTEGALDEFWREVEKDTGVSREAHEAFLAEQEAAVRT